MVSLFINVALKEAFLLKIQKKTVFHRHSAFDFVGDTLFQEVMTLLSFFVGEEYGELFALWSFSPFWSFLELLFHLTHCPLGCTYCR